MDTVGIVYQSGAHTVPATKIEKAVESVSAAFNYLLNKEYSSRDMPLVSKS